MFTFLEKAAICRNRLWFLVGNIISLYLALFHIQASLGTIVCTHIYFTHLVFTAKFDYKYACLKVTKQRGFFFFPLMWIWHVGCILLCYFLKSFFFMWPTGAFPLFLLTPSLNNDFPILLHSSRDKTLILGIIYKTFSLSTV